MNTRELLKTFDRRTDAEWEALARLVCGLRAGDNTFEDNMEAIRPGLAVARAWIKSYAYDTSREYKGEGHGTG
jgi:hypothetical protein